ncbi:MAG TPA: crotonase/enoyl-CoA hydratase family protein [Nevskiaceae bacterium]
MQDSGHALSTEQRGKVLLVTIDRPDKRNALNAAAILELERLVSAPPAQVGCIAVVGAGVNFSAGLDLGELVVRDTAACLKHSRLWHRCMDAVQYAAVPVVAAMHGAVIGGGLELAAAAHIRVADATTYYALPEAARGLFVGGGGSVRLPRLMGVARMTDMMLTGRVIEAEEGQAVGLSQYLVAAGEAVGTALKLAGRISENTLLTNFAVTHVLPRIAESSSDAGFVTEALIASLAQSDTQAKERLHRFLNGEAPRVKPAPRTAGGGL